MARASKFTASPSSAFPKQWRVGCYYRLSREDGDGAESESISSQKEIADYYLSKHDDLVFTDEYADDGYSGTNFERPAFQRMIEDIKHGHINCIVVKDLSRFGRNYIEVGNYLEIVFPMLNVRFIAINDMIDSEANPDSATGTMTSFRNVMNDEYCRDISNKVRSSLNIRRKQGKFIGSFASYGYLKDPNDHSKLIIDEEAAPVVQDIFQWFIAGESMIGIAKRLNEQGVLNPSAYKRYKGMKYKHPQHDMNDSLWPDSSVRRILTNQLYVGDMVQGKNKIKSYKLQVSAAVPRENWIIVKDTHEAIIDRETFQKVQDIFARDHRTPPGKRRCYVLSGYVRCADCKRAMNRKLISQPYADYGYYVCSTFKKMNRGACTKHTIRSDKLEKAVLETIKAHIQLAVSLDEIIADLKEQKVSAQSSKRLEKSLSAREDELQSVNNLKLDLYPDFKRGIITQDEYVTMKARFDLREQQIRDEIERIQQEIEAFRNVTQSDNAFLTYFLAHKNIEKLTRETVVELIDMIYVHEGGEITIQFKYRDEYLRLIDIIKEQGLEVPAFNVAS